jgi:hypothetical protein
LLAAPDELELLVRIEPGRGRRDTEVVRTSGVVDPERPITDDVWRLTALPRKGHCVSGTGISDGTEHRRLADAAATEENGYGARRAAFVGKRNFDLAERRKTEHSERTKAHCPSPR